MNNKDSLVGKELFFTNTKKYYIDEEKKLYPFDEPNFLVRSRNETKMALENGISKNDFVKKTDYLLDQIKVCCCRNQKIALFKEVFDLILKYKAILNYYTQFYTAARNRLLRLSSEEGWDEAQEYFKKLFPEDILSLFM